MIQGNLGLSIRMAEPFEPTQVAKMNARHVAKWLDALPIANVSAASKRIYQLLLECNKSDLSDDERFKILLLLHPPIQTLLKSLSKHFTSQTLNLTEKQRKVAALVQAIHTEMAIGCKMIVEHQAESPSLLKKSMLHSSMFLSIEYLSLTVLRCYQIYTNVPDRLWGEINTLYRYAIEQRLHQKHSQFEGFSSDKTIEDVFLKICLLSIANPYQLRQQEIETVYQGLSGYIDLCGLEAANRFDNRFAIDLNQSKPPLHQALVKIRPNQYSFAFNLEQVVGQLQDEIRHKRLRVNEEVALGGLSIRLIRHLLKNWAHVASRHFARTPCDSHIKICVGLTATHHMLAGPEQATLEDNTVETLESLEGSLQNASILDGASFNVLQSFGNEGITPEPKEEDIWEKLYRPKDAMPPSVESYQQASYSSGLDSKTEADKEPPLVDATIVNISPGGYCIELGDDLPAHTQTGEVIGLAEDGAIEGTWSIGVIRWIRRSKNHPGIQLGVQLIAPDAKPIHSQLHSYNNKGRNYHNALLLPALKSIGQPATLLTSPTMYNSKQRVLIVDGDDAYEARLTKLLSSSQGYRQFVFERVETSEKPTPRQSNPFQTLDDNLDTVWDLI